MAANDPAVTELAAQLKALDAALTGVEAAAKKAREGISSTGDKSAEAAAKTTSLRDSISDAARRFNDISDAASKVSNGLGAAIDHTIALAVEQGRLSATSTQMGLDFDAAAAAAGKFADETSAMQAASQFAAREVRLTQAELNALARVAGHAAEVLGTTADVQMADLTDALISGRARGLAPYGSALQALGGDSHTLGERLHALVASADGVALATDNAADRMARFRDALDDAKRTVASAAANEFMRLTDLADSTSTAADSTERWNRNLTAVGQTIGRIVAMAAGGLGAVVGTLATAVSGILDEVRALASGLYALVSQRSPAAAMAALRATRAETARGSTTADLWAFTQGQVASLEAIAADDQATTAGAASRDSVRRAPGRTADQNARNRRGGSSGTYNDTANARALDAQFAAARGAPVSSDWASAFLAELRRLAGAQTAAEGGTIGSRLAGVTLQRDSAEANLGLGRGRQGADFNPTTADGRDRAARERITILREQREALRELNVEAERAETMARAAGAPTDEVNGLMRQRIEIQRALAQSTQDLAAAQEAQSTQLDEFATKMKDALGSTSDAFAEAVAAASEGSKGFGAAMEDMLRSTLRALLKMSIVEGLKNIALGIGHLASFNYPGAASAFAAAGAWAAVGVAAGVGTAAMAKPTAPASTGLAPSGTGSGVGARPDTAARPDRSAGGPLNLTVVVSGAIFETRHEVLQGIGRGVSEARVHGYLPEFN